MVSFSSAASAGGWYGDGDAFFSNPFVDTGPINASGPSTFSGAAGAGGGGGVVGGSGSGVGIADGFADAIYLTGQSGNVVNSFGGGRAGSSSTASARGEATGAEGSSGFGSASAASKNAGSSSGF